MTPAKARPLSAKNFREPLLLTLGSLTAYQAGKPIKFESTYTPIFKLMHISHPDSYGKTPNNILWVERWIQFAFQDLCGKGLATRAGRGKWMLTLDGVQESLTKAALKPAPWDEEEMMTEATIPEVTAPAKSVPAPTPTSPAPPTGVSIPVGPNLPADLYHDDAYIRGVAAKGTDCLGAFSDQAPTCSDCLIRNSCANVVAAQLSRMTVALNVADFKAAPPPVLVADKAPVAAPSSGPPKVVVMDASAPVVDANYDWIAQAQVNVINARVTMKCRHCQGLLNEGSPAVWAHLPGATATRGSAMFHKNCFTEITGRAL